MQALQFPTVPRLPAPQALSVIDSIDHSKRELS
jgi:hypothetical protein